MDLRPELKTQVDEELNSLLSNPLKKIPSLDKALEYSKKYNLSLHPRYLLYLNELSATALHEFILTLYNAEYKENKLILSQSSKPFCDVLGVEHSLEKLPLDQIKQEELANILQFDEMNSQILFLNLGFNIKESNFNSFKEHLKNLEEYCKSNLEKTSIEIINHFSTISIRDKGGSYIGCRMGRPEKAKMRKLDGRPHGLFPIGHGRRVKSEKRFDTGESKDEIIQNRLRNIIETIHDGEVYSEFCMYKCTDCHKESVYIKCIHCDGKTEPIHFHRYEGNEVKEDNEMAIRYRRHNLDLEPYISDLRKVLETVELPKLVKGIKGTTNKDRVTEHLAKAFLREKNNVYVNKDGSVRFDMIEMGLTHFTPKEIGTSIDKLKELGYLKDIQGEDLTSEDQLLEIFPQDVILPDCKESGDELASDFIMNTGKFVDDVLVKLYKLDPFYNFETKEDTIGHLIIGLAPHTSAGIVGRIIGYSQTQGCFSHPVWHAAQRRNLDGDENGVMLLLDGLINFSRKYLPNSRGSRSVSKDTIVFLEEKGTLIAKEIGSYIDEQFKNKKILKDEEGFEVMRIKNLKTFAFDQKGKVSLHEVSKLIRHKCDKKMYEIKTSEGFIKTSEDHSVFTVDFDTGGIEEKQASQLKKNDFLVTLSQLPVKETTSKVLKTSQIGIQYDKRFPQISNSLSLDTSFFKLVGFIYAEGHVRGNGIEIGNTKISIITEFQKYLESIIKTPILIGKDQRKHKYTLGKYYRLNIPTNFVRILKYLGLKEQKAKCKEIPDFVYKTSKENIEAFLEGYCLGDGTKYNSKLRNYLRLYTSSQELAAGLSLLAFICSKRSSCRKSKEKTGENKYEVFISDYKPRTSFYPLRHLRPQLNKGLINSGYSSYERYLLLANIVKNTRIKSSSKQKIEKLITALEKSPKNKQLVSQLRKIITQDIRVELVNEVKEIDYKGDIYDLEVPGVQNFLCGPHPIFAHNTMDTSLVLTSHLYLDQIDDEVHGMDIVPYYPLQLYKAAKEFTSPKELKIEKVGSRLDIEDMDEKYFNHHFTHTTTSLNNTNMCSSYKSVPSMIEKLDLQLDIAKKIRAVNEDEVGTLIIDKHFMKDIKGNLRQFGMQSFRCTNCNTIYRRPPLSGKCTECSSPSINFTIHEGSIKKYLKPSFDIIRDFNVDPYIVETLELANLRVEGVFGKEEDKQKSLNQFFG